MTPLLTQINQLVLNSTFQYHIGALGWGHSGTEKSGSLCTNHKFKLECKNNWSDEKKSELNRWQKLFINNRTSKYPWTDSNHLWQTFWVGKKKLAKSCYPLYSPLLPMCHVLSCCSLSEKHNLLLNELTLMNSHVAQCQSKSNAIGHLCQLNGKQFWYCASKQYKGEDVKLRLGVYKHVFLSMCRYTINLSVEGDAGLPCGRCTQWLRSTSEQNMCSAQ